MPCFFMPPTRHCLLSLTMPHAAATMFFPCCQRARFVYFRARACRAMALSRHPRARAMMRYADAAFLSEFCHATRCCDAATATRRVCARAEIRPMSPHAMIAAPPRLRALIATPAIHPLFLLFQYVCFMSSCLDVLFHVSSHPPPDLPDGRPCSKRHARAIIFITLHQSNVEQI